ncbi:transporter substrate-binding domain-containing protein [Lonepinella koalarum]|uniref:Amino acid ABC transporter substrate-binding protein (PAAT family) n=1 Tax=Lonepinella koalarum TaxID=53417 RepID=A0A4R1KZW8_9PAST|nr:transporter substrate-binding domain-containing protein [Lonepinella koalarum]MDH2926006.1 hypothetical protein [Lonepinella koalarum]TCK71158.1 amino acid ABC transporter substrate-binding protein (PAAT family) [Lonepinella koalarum]TFJ90886.1 transporter substrate-binding domain-containing protein [Lonepinella koalarum]TYG34674.1 transporter substrate-binding domain-containing protein [Lonepinella koalarum]
MKYLIKKISYFFLIILTAMTFLFGCDNKSADNEVKNKKIIVAVNAKTKPYNYLNEAGELTGYEIEMVNEIAHRLGYDVDYQITEFESMFAGLDSRRYDVIVGNISKKPEREEKYLFSRQPYFKNKIVLITAKHNQDIRSIDDLGGKRVPAGAGRANALFMQSYNEKNPNNQIDIQYTDADASSILVDLHNGRYDASVYNQTYVINVQKEYGYEFNIYSIPNADEIEIPEAWFLFNKSSQDLESEFNSALVDIKKDGTLSSLSVKYFGNDYVPQ